MPEIIKRRCPQCGRKAHDRLLVQCPDCRVPFVLEEPPTLTPEQIQLLATQVFGSWKFWAVLLLVVAGAAWAIVNVADRVIDARAKTYLSTLEQSATNHIGVAFGQISNQITQEFRQPRIQNAIEQVARQRAAEIITNGVRPSLESFLDAMDAASNQLLQSSNAIAQLQRNALAAEKRIPPPATATPIDSEASNPVPVLARTATKPAPAAASNPDTSNTLRLSMANQAVVQAGTSYFLTVIFRANNNSVGGPVTMEAGTYNQTATILGLQSSGTTAAANPVFNTTADAARLQFTVIPGISPTVVLELSAPTIVRLTSDSLDSALTIPVAAEKMLLPSASNKPTGN